MKRSPSNHSMAGTRQRPPRSAQSAAETATGPHCPASVEYENVTKVFNGPTGQFVAVRDIRASAVAGGITAFIGPSGCGKSTLLKAAAGIDPPSQGRVLANGIEITSISTAFAAKVGFVTQEANLLPWMNVLDNVALPLRIQGVAKKEREDRARDWLDRVGLSGFSDFYPRQLSGGMQKRCSVARTMVYEPRIILMDEPFGALDAITRLTLQDLVARIHRAAQALTIILVTHDLGEAIALGDRVMVITGSPGSVRHIVDVPVLGERDVYSALQDPKHAEIQGQLWGFIEEGMRG